jgi:hypothetical protein
VPAGADTATLEGRFERGREPHRPLAQSPRVAQPGAAPRDGAGYHPGLGIALP